MLVSIYFNGGPIEYECQDVSGLLATLKEVEYIHFASETYQYDSSVLGFYTDDNGEIKQQLIIHVK